MSEKKIAVVTGGARGIGKAIALELAKAGNLVVINYNGSEEKARETKAEIEAAGGQADILQCNVADFDACEAFFKAVAEKYGRPFPSTLKYPIPSSTKTKCDITRSANSLARFKNPTSREAL